jgi:hypothetical protein
MKKGKSFNCTNFSKDDISIKLIKMNESLHAHSSTITEVQKNKKKSERMSKNIDEANTRSTSTAFTMLSNNKNNNDQNRNSVGITTIPITENNNKSNKSKRNITEVNEITEITCFSSNTNVDNNNNKPNRSTITTSTINTTENRNSGLNTQSMATESTELSNNTSSSSNSNRNRKSDNPVCVDTTAPPKYMSVANLSVVKDNNNNNRGSTMMNDSEDQSSVCYDNKDEVLKNILLLQQQQQQQQLQLHHEEISSKKSIKFKSIFRRKKSSSHQHYSFSKFNSIKSNFEDIETIDCKKQSHYVVEIRVVFYKVGEIDTLNEKFYVEAYIEASWIDPYLDRNKIYNPKQNWNPELLIQNSIGVLKEEIWYSQSPFRENNSQIVIHQSKSDLNKSDCICTKMCDLDERQQKPGCLVIERRRINGMFWQLLDLKDFPSDVQNLTLTISTSKHSSEISLLHSREKYSSVNVNCFLDHQEWHLYKHVRVKEFLRESVFSSETFPSIDLTICVARRPAFYYLNAFFLIFLITISSLAVFSVNCSLPQNRLQTSCTLLLTSVTFKWVTNRALPTVSYMTSLDKYSLGCIIIVCMQCIWHGVIGYLNHAQNEAKCVDPYSKFDFFAFIITCSLFLLLNFSFLIIFIRLGCCKRRQLNRLETDYINNLVGKRVTRLKSMLHGI